MNDTKVWVTKKKKKVINWTPSKLKTALEKSALRNEKEATDWKEISVYYTTDDK